MLKVSTIPMSVGATAIIPYSDGQASALSYMSKYGDPVQMWRRVGNSMHIPRGLARLSEVPADRDHRVLGQLLPELVPALKAKDSDQQQVLDRSWELMSKGVDHLVEAPTGWGKTWLGVSLGMKIRRPVLIVVTKNDLVDGWWRMMTASPTAAKKPGMGLPESMIGHVQASTEDWNGKRFVIGMIHSLVIPGKYSPDFWRYFGLGIFDECHRLGADTFQEVCNLLPARHRLGLSATPDRADGKDRVFQAHIGPVMARGKIVPMNPKILVKQTGWYIPEGLKYAPGRMGHVLNIMCKSKTRNNLILEFVQQAYKTDRTTVVMSDLVENHLEVLFKLFTANGISGADIGFYIGQNTSDKQLAKINLGAAAEKRIVLATYAMAKEGTDFPHWDTLVLATPKGDVKQAIGRVMRLKPDKKEPVVLDLVDANKVFQNYHLNRLKQYFSVGGKVVKIT